MKFITFLLIILSLGLLSQSVLIKTEMKLNDGLVGHWTFEQNLNKVIDQSPYGADAELKGDPKFTQGIVGKSAIHLDGKNDYLEILKNDEPPAHIQKLEIGSISLWFKADNIPVGENILPIMYYGNKNGCKNMFDASNEGFIIELAHGSVYPNAKGIFYTVFSNHCDYPSLCYDSHSDPHIRDQQGKIYENQWYHFVVVVGKQYNTGYLNGQEMEYRHYNFNSAKASQFFADALSHQRFWLGKGYWNHAQETYFEGALDDIRIYDRPLSKKEVSELYALRKVE